MAVRAVWLRGALGWRRMLRAVGRAKSLHCHPDQNSCEVSHLKSHRRKDQPEDKLQGGCAGSHHDDAIRRHDRQGDQGEAGDAEEKSEATAERCEKDPGAHLCSPRMQRFSWMLRPVPASYRDGGALSHRAQLRLEYES